MSKKLDKKQTYWDDVMSWSKYFGSIFEDFSRHVIGFIPNGLNQIYEKNLKQLPFLSVFFKHRWFEQLLKLMTGITLGQGLAADIGRFIFWPMGFITGGICGAAILANVGKSPNYRGRIGKVLFKLSYLTVLMFIFGACIGCIQSYRQNTLLPTTILMMATAFSGVALVLQVIYMMALNKAHNQNRELIKHHARQAKQLGSTLKQQARQQAKSKILIEAQDLLQQMNGASALTEFEPFIQENFEQIADETYNKIDRHLNYLIDKAVSGNDEAYQKIKYLSQSSRVKAENNALKIMVDRIFSARTLAQLKDRIDTQFDWWHYRHLRVS